MKILLIPAWYDKSNPQTGSFFHEFAQALGKVHEVSLLKTMYYSYSQKIENIDDDRIKDRSYKYFEFVFKSNFPIKGFSLATTYQKKRMLKLANKTVAKIEQEFGEFDVVHLLSACSNLNPLMAQSIAKSNGIPFVVTEHFSGFDRMTSNSFVPFTSFDEIKGIVASADARFGVSDGAIVNYERIFNCDFKKCNNLVPDSFYLQNHTEINSSSLFEFLIVGSLDDNKGQLRVLKAFNAAVNSVASLRLTIIGKGVDKTKVLAYIKEHKLEKVVTYIEEVSREDIITYFDKCNVLISASRIETFGLTIVEAQFRGKPSICTKSGGPNEIVSDENGILIEIDNHQELLSAMINTYQNYNKYNSQKIIELATSRYSEKVIVNQMTAVYKDLVMKKK